MAPEDFDDLMAEVRGCRLCEAHLPLGPRPILRGRPTARLLIVGQAPGTRVHASGLPWDDRSGERLRQWMGLDRCRFYDEALVAILPAGLCYPGRAVNGGDLPPRPECAPLWHPRVRPALANVQLTLLVGGYAQALYLDNRRAPTMTETVQAFRSYLPSFLPMPHPSWRTTAWERKNPWFTDRLLPDLRDRLATLLGPPSPDDP